MVWNSKYDTYGKYLPTLLLLFFRKSAENAMAPTLQDDRRDGATIDEGGNDRATAAAVAGGRSATKATAPPPPPPPTITTTTTKWGPSPIEREEDPSDVPPDEYAFLVPPHFSGSDPFHRDLSLLDLSMRCVICKEFYKAPVTLLPCFHSFCSLCVRNHFRSTYTG